MDHLFPIISPFLVIPGCGTNRVRWPLKWCHSGVLDVFEGYVTYRERVTSLTHDAKRFGVAVQYQAKSIMDRWWYIKDTIRPWAVLDIRWRPDPARRSTVFWKVHSWCTEELLGWSNTVRETVCKGHFKPREFALLPVEVLVQEHMKRAFDLRKKARKTSIQERSLTIDRDDSTFIDYNAEGYGQTLHWQVKARYTDRVDVIAVKPGELIPCTEFRVRQEHASGQPGVINTPVESTMSQTISRPRDSPLMLSEDALRHWQELWDLQERIGSAAFCRWGSGNRDVEEWYYLG